MTESSVNEITDYIGNALGLHPPLFELVGKTNETIITLARLGNCVIVGRGGNLLTKNMALGFHVRLVAPYEWRLKHLRKARILDEKEAAAYIKETDKGRRRYIDDHFDVDVDDALQYDCVINTGLMSFEAAAAMIAGHVDKFY
jgi:cytidylate kinase